MKLRKIIGVNVQALRAEKNLSQDDLAKLVRVNKQTIWRLESGLTDTGADMVDRIGKALKVDVSELLTPMTGKVANVALAKNLKRLGDIEECLSGALRMIKSLDKILRLQGNG